MQALDDSESYGSSAETEGIVRCSRLACERRRRSSAMSCARGSYCWLPRGARHGRLPGRSVRCRGQSANGAAASRGRALRAWMISRALALHPDQAVRSQTKSQSDNIVSVVASPRTKAGRAPARLLATKFAAPSQIRDKMTYAERVNADAARSTCAQFDGISERVRTNPGVSRQKLDPGR